MSDERHHEIVQMLSKTCIYSDNLARSYTTDVTDLLSELGRCRAVLSQRTAERDERSDLIVAILRAPVHPETVRMIQAAIPEIATEARDDH